MRSQTATEYLIILAVVIIIALIVITTLGGIPGIAGPSMDETLLAKWKTNPNIAVQSWSITKYGTTLEISNVAGKLLRLTSMNISGYSYSLNRVLNVGEKTSFFFFYPYYATTTKYNIPIKISYVDLATNAEYTISNSELSLKGSSGRMSTSDISLLRNIAYYWRANQTTDTISDLVLTYAGSVAGDGSLRRAGSHKLTGYSTAITYSSVLSPQNTPLTVSMWANNTVCAGGGGYILGNGWGFASSGYDINLAANYSIRVGGASITTQCTAGAWTHLAFTYDGTTVKLYRDGELSGSFTPGTVNTGSGYGGGGFKIGMESGGSDTATVPSEYSDVIIYNRALSASEVANIYAEFGELR